MSSNPFELLYLERREHMHARNAERRRSKRRRSRNGAN